MGMLSLRWFLLSIARWLDLSFVALCRHGQLIYMPTLMLMVCVMPGLWTSITALIILIRGLLFTEIDHKRKGAMTME
jgi:hypothetical protein